MFSKNSNRPDAVVSSMEVNTLAVLVSLVVLILVTLSNKVYEKIIDTFMKSRLITHNETPLISATDFEIHRLPFSLIKYRRSTAIFLTLVVHISLFVSEIIIGFGVDSADNCPPGLRWGTVISKRNINIPPEIKIVPVAYNLMALEFADGEFEHVLSGYPRRIHSELCVSCLPARSDENTILAGCSIRHEKEYDVGELSIGVLKAERTFGTVVFGFREEIEPNRNFTTMPSLNISDFGDHTFNGKNYFGFFFSPVFETNATDITNGTNSNNTNGNTSTNTPNNNQNNNKSNNGRTQGQPRDTLENTDEPETLNGTVRYLEYGNQVHLEELFLRAENNTNEQEKIEAVWEPTRSRVTSKIISCENNSMVDGAFIRGLLVYRSVFVENIDLVHFNNETERFRNLSVADIYRSALALKAVEDPDIEADENVTTGMYKEFTSCGQFNWIFAIPTGVCLILTLFLTLWSMTSRVFTKSMRSNAEDKFAFEKDDDAPEHANTRAIEAENDVEEEEIRISSLEELSKIYDIADSKLWAIDPPSVTSIRDKNGQIVAVKIVRRRRNRGRGRTNRSNLGTMTEETSNSNENHHNSIQPNVSEADMSASHSVASVSDYSNVFHGSYPAGTYFDDGSGQ